jgi:PilZ domain-containing protein
MYNERRRCVRKHVRYPVWISERGGATPKGCFLHDISQSGARLEVEAPERLPERFVLLFTLNGRVQRSCRAVWRAVRHVGVQFDYEDATEAEGSATALP